MAVEMERKFLVVGDDWEKEQGTYVCQGYLNRDKERTVRVRIAGRQAFLTVKGVTTGFARAEFEYEIPVDHAEQMLQLCDGPLIEKIRYTVNEQGFFWEVDEFLGDNKGLVVAEIELESPDQEFIRPSWLGEEVTENPRYFNSNLAVDPYLEWHKPKD